MVLKESGSRFSVARVGLSHSRTFQRARRRGAHVKETADRGSDRSHGPRRCAGRVGIPRIGLSSSGSSNRTQGGDIYPGLGHAVGRSSPAPLGERSGAGRSLGSHRSRGRPQASVGDPLVRLGAQRTRWWSLTGAAAHPRVVYKKTSRSAPRRARWSPVGPLPSIRPELLRSRSRRRASIGSACSMCAPGRSGQFDGLTPRRIGTGRPHDRRRAAWCPTPSRVSSTLLSPNCSPTQDALKALDTQTGGVRIRYSPSLMPGPPHLPSWSPDGEPDPRWRGSSRKRRGGSRGEEDSGWSGTGGGRLRRSPPSRTRSLADLGSSRTTGAS